eukprot:TRINITY_DN55_c0_g1_i4.p1 TRINITY_DN55_c0_g1~~TRINITY_DN55_c0_g1_i4.p1  ORF type:complete len:671 (+),score=295.62 TRINITY_DN55_c0_g1_i4:103-2013(+)
MAAQQGSQGQAQSSSLYVGDLLPDVTEANLFDVFREVGPVLSIRVCRDAVSRRSLGYAYVNFQNPIDAQRALDTLNFTDIRGKQCRIMWCRRDPSLRKSASGNVFIKNLARDIDNKALHDTFQAFGQILSSKVVVDDRGNSRGYGFVHFSTEEAADEACNKVNGMLLNGQPVFVGKFERKEKKLAVLKDTFTNIYVKHFKPDLSEDDFIKFFSKFGKIATLKGEKNPNAGKPAVRLVQTTSRDGKARGFGFILYEDHESAARAVAEANGLEDPAFVDDKRKLYVARHQRRDEREHLRREQQRKRQQQFMKYSNLYVKNLDDSVTSEVLREAFSEFGEIVSCKVMTGKDEAKTSLGFGFVCLKDAEAANKAVAAMNGRIFNGKPLYVALAQKKDARKAQLELYYRSGRQPGMQPGMPGMGGGAGPGGMPFGAQGGGMGMAMGGPGMGGMGGMGGPGMGGNFPQSRGPQNRGGPRPMQQQQRQQFPLGGGRVPGPMGGMPPMGGMGMMPGFGQAPMQRMPQQMPGFQQQSMQRPMQQPMQSMMPMQNMPQMQVRQAPAGEIDPGRLATMSQEQQKNLLGEKLFAKVSMYDAQNAAKITGMLLEMDNAEIINLVDSPQLLQPKVQEALEVLRQHQASQH